jgi:hypothetical protein
MTYKAIYDSRRWVRSDSTDVTILQPLSAGGTGSDLSATGGPSEVLMQVTAGAPITVAQLATTDLSNFGAWTDYTPTRTASAGTWTAGTILESRYLIIGKTMFLRFQIIGSSVSSGVANDLLLTLPPGVTGGSVRSDGTGFTYDSGSAAQRSIMARVAASASVIDLVLNTQGAGMWGASTLTTDVVFQMFIEIA